MDGLSADGEDGARNRYQRMETVLNELGLVALLMAVVVLSGRA